MSSLYDELAAKVDAETSVTKRSVPRFDLSLLLFNARADIRELWAATDACTAADSRVEAAVEKLRPIFGERAKA